MCELAKTLLLSRKVGSIGSQVEPEAFPLFRPEVFAEELSLPRHQNPLAKNLCLLPRPSQFWDVSKTIGEHFDGRDHITVIHSCQTVKDLMDTDGLFKENVIELTQKVQLASM